MAACLRIVAATVLLLLLLACQARRGVRAEWREGRDEGGRTVPTFSMAKFATHGPDVRILHPADGAEIEEDEQGFIIAAYISSFCVERLGGRLQGLRLIVNDHTVVEQPLQVHGNDGSAQYHIRMAELEEGVYRIRAEAIVGEWGGEGEEEGANDDEITITIVQKGKLERQENHGHGNVCWGMDGEGSLVGNSREGGEEVCDVTCGMGGCCEQCSGHGVCAVESGNDDACLCVGDWFGRACSQNIFTATSHLPIGVDFDAGHASLATAASGLRGRRRWFTAAALLKEELGKVGGCEDGVKVSIASKAFGAQMHFLALGLSAALARGKPLIFDQDRWAFGNHLQCETTGWECYFVARFCGCPDAEGLYLADHLRDGMFPVKRWEGMGVFWWRSTLLASLLTPSSSLLLKLRTIQSNLNWAVLTRQGSIVGMHIRRGDSCLHALMSASRPLCLPVTAYLDALRGMVEGGLNVSGVYLATDDPGVVQEVSDRLAAWPGGGIRVLFLGFERIVFSAPLFIEHRLELGFADVSLVAETSVIDLILLSRCDALVVGFGSQLARLAMALMASRVGQVPWFVSVDGYSWGRHAQEEVWEIIDEVDVQ